MRTLLHHKGTLVIVIFLLSMFFVISSTQPALAVDDTATISGEIVSIAYGSWTPFGRRPSTVIIKDKKNKEHTVYAGRRTTFLPERKPVIGDKVTATCIRNKGVWVVILLHYK